ncbi:MAG: ATP-binding protein [Acidovorax sp.]|uniref:sensor histidine kinase n=1 Tax=Acidovorax sp. TaxID=1872122 RepID=UPI0039E6E347
MALADRLIHAVDWFIPVELRKSTATLWRARIFVISHVLGPFSGVAILGYLYHVLPEHDWVFWVICVLCTSFWALPLALKLAGDLFRPALYSFCTLIGVSVFGAFFYGGVSSPFMPWFLTAQMLGFFYLSGRPLLVLGIIGANLTAFAVAYFVNGAFPERVSLHDLSIVGMISVCMATLYSSMMAIYYAYVMVAHSALQEEIKNHLETTAKLRIAKHEAERANEAKAVFLAKMSHQLRTPLNAIIGYSEILLEDAEASDPVVDVEELRSINHAGRHLLSLVSDVLRMPKSDAEGGDSDDIEIKLQPVDLDRCLDELSATCRTLVENNGNQLTCDKPSVLGTIQTDEIRLRQILINLLGNAGKFTRNGTVALRAWRATDGGREQVFIAVQDTGIGISAEAIPKLFKDFNQLNAGQYAGSGLGLAVSQKLAHLLGGDISVESQLNRGSEFTLRLPMAAEAA